MAVSTLGDRRGKLLEQWAKALIPVVTKVVHYWQRSWAALIVTLFEIQLIGHYCCCLTVNCFDLQVTQCMRNIINQ
jgi:hypothetical protein